MLDAALHFHHRPRPQLRKNHTAEDSPALEHRTTVTSNWGALGRSCETLEVLLLLQQML
jgi:hypothetical protein